MSAIFSSIDETLARIKDETHNTIQEHKDTIFTLQTELALHKGLTRDAQTERDKYMRIATQLITQFGTVEKVFSEAKEMALALTRSEATSTDADRTLPEDAERDVSRSSKRDDNVVV